MIDLVASLVWSRHYLARPRWDLDPPAELEALLAPLDPAAAGEGRSALDIGCGTGRVACRLAGLGYRVVGIDLAALAIWKARARARRLGAGARFLLADFLRSRPPALGGPFDLLVDVGCFHLVPAALRAEYLARLEAVAAPRSRWVLFALAPGERPGVGGVEAAELAALPGWELEASEGQWHRLGRRRAGAG